MSSATSDRKSWARLASALLCGWLFALGLGISGMTRPSKVLGFLDVAGAWDPTLLFVMGGAVGLGLFMLPRILKRPAPLFDEQFVLPEKRSINGRLLTGAALFGIGWGLVGYCPGPALVALVSLKSSIWLFVLAMLAGLGLGERYSK
jgi:uncharacterized membrane protein YedE/YeeE